jgi:hypothetical protein
VHFLISNENAFVEIVTFSWCHNILHNDTQLNDIQHKDTQHKGLICDTQHKWQVPEMTLSITTLYQCEEFHYAVTHFIYCSAECHYAECHDTECHGAVLMVAPKHLVQRQWRKWHQEPIL